MIKRCDIAAAVAAYVPTDKLFRANHHYALQCKVMLS